MHPRLSRRAFLTATGALLLAGYRPLVARADQTYTVQPGDTLSGIALRFNVSLADLMRANHISDPNAIYAGQVLIIPTPAAATPLPAAPPPQTFSLEPGPILATRRLVTYYGNPWASQMGILGESEPATVIAKLREQAAVYAALSNRPVQPALHLVATVAQDVPGNDNKYRFQMPTEVIESWSKLAEQNNMLLILDLQPGRSTVIEEVEAIRSFLERPHVHLALDPEFNMSLTQVPGQVIGSMTANEINESQKLLSKLVETGKLPNKVLIVHQFEGEMLVKKEKIKTYPHVEVAIMMDGFGNIDTKLAKYNWLVRDQPVAYAGIKLFYRWDKPLFTPQQIIGLTPIPDIIVYQ